MIRDSNAKGFTMAIKGPWDTPDNNNGGAEPPKGNGNNPWDPAAAGNKGDGKVTSLEELLRKRKGGGGGGSWGGLPQGAGGKSVWFWGIGLLAILWLVWTSFHRLEPAESGVITTFGKYSRTVGPGVSFTFPYPIQNLVKVDTARSRTVSVGSKDGNTENLIITKDRNVINMVYNVRWRVSDPELYLFQLENPDETVREVAESAMRAAIANFNFDQATFTNRKNVQAAVIKRSKEILNLYRSGIEITGIDIREAERPADVEEAFLEVDAAKNQAIANKNEARKYARQITERALGETAEFDKIYVQYREAPGVTKRRIYYETMEQILATTDKTIVETGDVTPYLPLPEIKKRAEKSATQVNVEGGNQ